MDYRAKVIEKKIERPHTAPEQPSTAAKTTHRDTSAPESSTFLLRKSSSPQPQTNNAAPTTSQSSHALPQPAQKAVCLLAHWHKYAKSEVSKIPAQTQEKLSYPLSVHPYVNLPWHTINEHAIVRSKRGVTAGVFFLLFHSQTVVAKMAGSNAGAEYFTSLLAKACGLTIPEPITLLAESHAQIQKSLNIPAKSPILLMNRVVGCDFVELPLAISNAIKTCQPNGLNIVKTLGEIAIFDYLIGNNDRFDLPALHGNNKGNLMLRLGDQQVVCIDNTCIKTVSAQKTATLEHYNRTLNKILHVVKTGHMGPHTDNKLLHAVERFLPQISHNNWQIIRQNFLTGMHSGVKKIQNVCPTTLQACNEKIPKSLACSPSQMAFFQQQLQTIQQTAAMLTPNAPQCIDIPEEEDVFKPPSPKKEKWIPPFRRSKGKHEAACNAP